MDWERFEAEFADLDSELDAGSSLADRILAVVRARRARRRVLTVVAGAMLAAGLVVSVLLVVLPGRPLTGPGPGPGPGAGSPGTGTRGHLCAAASGPHVQAGAPGAADLSPQPVARPTGAARHETAGAAAAHGRPGGALRPAGGAPRACRASR